MGADEERHREKVNEVLTAFFICHVSFERAIAKLSRQEFLGEVKEDLDKARFHLGQLALHIEKILSEGERVHA